MQKIVNKLKLFLDNKIVICVFAISAFAFNVYKYFYFNLFIGQAPWIFTPYPLNDYFTCFSKAVSYFLVDPSSIYSQTYLNGNVQIPFRNLPAFLLYYGIFYLFAAQNHIDFFICSSCIIIWNFGSCILIIKILKLQKFKENQSSSIFSSSAIILPLFLLNFWQQFEYFQGDDNVITGFFVLLGIYFFLSNREHLGYVAWSIAVTFKITIIILIIFFLFQPPLKRFLKNVVYVLIPQFPNIMIFAFWPNLISDFVKYNIYTATNVLELDFFYSGSIARELSWAFSLPLVPLVIPFFIVFLALNLYLCYSKSQRLTFINRLMLAFLTAIVVFPDYVRNHVLFFEGTFILWIASRNDHVFSKSTKIIVGLPTVSWIFYTTLINLMRLYSIPVVSLFFLIPLIIIDYRLFKLSKSKSSMISSENPSYKMEESIAPR